MDALSTSTPWGALRRALLCSAAAALQLLAGGCGEEAGKPGSGGGATPPAPRSWSPQEISQDPEGYLAWADKQIAQQGKAREEFLVKLAKRQTEVRERQKGAGADLTELENFLQRLKTAVQRAEDEDRWPVKVGLKSYERQRAQELLAQLPRQIELRKPLALEYEAALEAMAKKAGQVGGEIADLGRLREKIALDLERVRLHVGAAELEKLGATSAEIEHYAKILGAISDDAAKSEPVAGPGQGGLIPLETLLK